MSEPKNEAAEGASANHLLYDPATGERRYLSSKPDHFFSHSFDLGIVQEDRVASSKPRRPFIRNALLWLLNDQTVPLILFVGIPLLAYCILSSP